MEDPAAADSTLVEQLLKYVDIPYFRNNPSYIKLWRTYYEQDRRIEVLLLMYHKQISTYYHWIYVELSKHFIRAGMPELAHFVLSEALAGGVYDRIHLADVLERVPAFTKKHSRGDMLCVLNQRNIELFGTVWNRFEEQYYYEQHLSPTAATFGMMSDKLLLKRSGALWDDYARTAPAPAQTCENSGDSLFHSTLRYGCAHMQNAAGDALGYEMDEMLGDMNKILKTSADAAPPCQDAEQQTGRCADACVENEAPNGVDSSYPKAGCCAATDSTACDKEADLPDSDCPALPTEGPSLCPASGDLAPGGELVVDDYVHIVQSQRGDSYVTMRIAKNADITQTISSKNYMIRKIEPANAAILSDARPYQFFRLGAAIFVTFEYDHLEELDAVLSRCNEKTCLFYLSQILVILDDFSSRGAALASPEFYVDSKFSVVLSAFEFAPLDEHSIRAVETRVAGLFAGFGIDFAQGLGAVSAVAAAGLAESDFKKELLKHKTTVLNAL
ncbi:hypothetical protein PAPHI01_2318 [Pancytospora philotis]|nr:hypothetical protein PAPHI01_2318 [Pancytospora philotis]